MTGLPPDPPALLLARDFPPLGGGIARMLGEIARHSPPGSLTVSTGIVRDCPPGAPWPGDIVDRIPVDADRLRTVSGLLRWGVRAAALARREEAGFIWAGNLRPAGQVARWVARRQGVPYGLIVYGLDVSLLAERAARSRLAGWRIRALLSGAAGGVAISGYTARLFASLAPALGGEEVARRIRVVLPGVDAGRFRPDAGVARESLRREFGLDGRPWALTVARLVPHKGVDTALQAIARLRASGTDIGYVVAGTGPAETALRRLAVDLRVDDRVRWLGEVPDERLPALYRAADLYLGLSREEGTEVEGFGLALLEAQASGLPVVAGRSGGTPDAVADGATGLLVEPREPAAAAAAVADLLASPGRAVALGTAARRRAVDHFSWERVAGELAEAARSFSPAGRGTRQGPAGR